MLKSSLASGLQECLGQLWGKDDFSDFTVIVEGKRYQCHRFILRACSKFFDSLLRSGMKEDFTGYTMLSNITSDIFDIIINSLYKGIDSLTQENVVSVWKAVHLLQIDYLIKECEDFVMRTMSLENYLEFYVCAKLLQSKNITKILHNFIIKNFTHFRKTQPFLDLTADELYMMAKSHKLNIESEELVIKSILQWVSHVPSSSSSRERMLGKSSNKRQRFSLDSDEVLDNNVKKGKQLSDNSQRDKSDQLLSSSTQEAASTDKQHANTSREGFRHGPFLSGGNGGKDDTRVMRLGKLLSAARINLLRPEYLQTLMKNPFISNNKDAMTVLLNAYFYQQSVHHTFWPPSAVHRACSDMTHVMVYVDAQRKQCMLYSLDNGSTHVLCEYPVVDNTVAQKDTKVFKCVKRLKSTSGCGAQPIAQLKKITLGTSDQMLFLGETLLINNKYETHIRTWEKSFGWRMATGSMKINLYKLLSLGQQFYMLCKNPQKKYEFCLGKIQMTTFNCPDSIQSAVSIKNWILLMTSTPEDKNLTSVSFYNRQTRDISRLDYLGGPPNYIISFHCGENVYILQPDGTLHLVIIIDDDSNNDWIDNNIDNVEDVDDYDEEDNNTNDNGDFTDDQIDNNIDNVEDVDDYDEEDNNMNDNGDCHDEVFFQFVAKLWNFNWKIYGAVVYKGELFIFGSPTDHSETWVKSVPDNPDFKNIRIIQIDRSSECLPMTVPKSWLKEFSSDIRPGKKQ